MTRETTSLESAERRYDAARRLTRIAAPLAALGALATMEWHLPATSASWRVVAVLVALATYETLVNVRGSLETAIAISAGAERLEELDQHARRGDAPWPLDAPLRAEGLVLREDDLVLATDVDLVLAPGERVAIVGPSGAGKSTLLRVLADLDTAHEGQVRVGDTPLRSMAEQTVRRHVLYQSSEPGLTDGLALDVLGLGREARRHSWDDLAALGIDAVRETRWRDLSHGERQRVALVRALYGAPDVLLLDEPTGGLGRDETDRVLALLEDVQATIVVVTHDARVAAWCDRTLELGPRGLTPQPLSEPIAESG